MANVKTVRAFDRGLQVIELLKTHRSATLGELHDRTGLSRATLLRLLKTLEDRDWVFFASSEGVYRLSPWLERTPPSDSLYSDVGALAAPILNRLCRKILWPSDVAVRDGLSMVILESSRRNSPFVIDRNIVGHRPKLLKSATGRAYLAFCPDEEREGLLSELRKSGGRDDRLANMERQVHRMINETQRQGFGVREPCQGSRFTHHGSAFNAIAVPILVHGRVIACMNIVWIADKIPVSEFASSYLKLLKAAADKLRDAILAAEGASFVPRSGGMGRL
ncbi:MAG: helix-turn-helix domain-containing protein [Alphaproteobacteria bacterium]|nr:helix-turn-helix domain-containing protein [Alphaproteobacteria bacterium]